MPTGQGIIYPDCVGEAAPTLGGGKGREGGKRKRREEEALGERVLDGRAILATV